MPAQPREESDFELWLQEQIPSRHAGRHAPLAHGARPRSRKKRAPRVSRLAARQASPPQRNPRAAAWRSSKRARKAREKQAAQQRAQHVSTLNRLVQEAPQIWQQIDTTLEVGTGAAYEKAFNLLQTLAEAMQHAHWEADFLQDLARLLVRHGRRPAWMKRLEKAGCA